MNKKQWKAEYSLWRAFDRAPDWGIHNEKANYNLIRKKNKVLDDNAHYSIVSAIDYNCGKINYYYPLEEYTNSGVRLNLQMTREACEAKRINDREG